MQKLTRTYKATIDKDGRITLGDAVPEKDILEKLEGKGEDVPKYANEVANFNNSQRKALKMVNKGKDAEIMIKVQSMIS